MSDKVYKYVLDFKAKTDKFSKDVGGIKGMLKGAAVAAAAMFAVDKIMDAAAAVADYAKEISGVRSEIQKLSGLQDAALDQATGQAQALAKGYQVDITEAIQASNAMMNTFGATSGDAFDVLNKGFATTANSNGDFLKQVKEYSTHFDEAGLSASEMVAIIAEGNKMGVFDDKTADSIKEGSIRLREMTKSTKDALAGIGLSSTQIQKDISTGAKSMFDVMQDVSKQLKTLPEQSPAVGAALADIFGGPGEDGIQFIRTLGDINTNLDTVVSKAGEASAAQIAWTEEMAEFHTVGAQVFGGTGEMITKVKTVFMSWINDGIKGLVDITNYFIDLYNESMVFRGAVEYIKLAFNQLWEGIKVPFKLIWNNLKAIGGAIKGIFTFDVGAIKEAFSKGLDGAVDIVKDYGKNSAENFMEAYKNTLTPTEKIKLISLSDDAAEAAGVQTGKKFAKGIAKGVDAGKTPEKMSFNPYLGGDEEIDDDLFDTSTAEGRANTYSAALGNLDKQLQKSSEWNKVFGNSFQATNDEIELTKQAIESLIEDGFKVSDPAIQKLKEDLEELNSVQYKLTGGVLAFANSLEAMSEQGAESFQEMGVAIANTVRDIIKALIAQGVAGAVSNALKDAPWPIGLIAAPLAATAATTLFNSVIPAFATGGVISGPTVGLVGEYPNAVNNPEWIGKRSDMLGDMKTAVSETGGGGGNFSFRFEDGALVAYLEHQNRKVGGFA